MDGSEMSGDEPTREDLERRVAELERANEELWRTNERLARERLTAHDSAAASIAPKLDAAESELEKLESSLSWRLTTPFRWPRKALRWLLHRARPIVRRLLG